MEGLRTDLRLTYQRSATPKIRADNGQNMQSLSRGDTRRAEVPYGSKADFTATNANVRFVPQADVFTRGVAWNSEVSMTWGLSARLGFAQTGHETARFEPL